MSAETIRLSAEDGLSIGATLFLPESLPKAGVIINSATAVKQRYYADFANYLTRNGYLVITYDYRGIGKSAVKNSRDKRLSLQAWGEKDLASVIKWTSDHYSQLPWHGVGHSAGGKIIGFAHNNTQLQSVYCVSSQVGYWKNWPLLSRAKMLALWYVVIPTISRLFGHLPHFMLGGESIPEHIARQWAFWGRNKKFVTDIGNRPEHSGFTRLNCPMKFISIDDDLNFAPEKAVVALKNLYSQADTQYTCIKAASISEQPIAHFGFFRKQFSKTLWPDAVDWLEKQSSNI